MPRRPSCLTSWIGSDPRRLVLAHGSGRDGGGFLGDREHQRLPGSGRVARRRFRVGVAPVPRADRRPEAVHPDEEEYPAAGRWSFVVNNLFGDQLHAVSDVFVSDGVVQARTVSLFTVQDSRIVRVVEYWPDDFPAPENRSHVVERIDSRDPEGGVAAWGSCGERRHTSSHQDAANGFTTESFGNHEKSRSADHNTSIPLLRQIAAIRASCTRGPVEPESCRSLASTSK